MAEEKIVAKEKIFQLDIMRAIAFLGVVFLHLLGAWARREAAMLSLKQLNFILVSFEVTRCITVPVFVFLSALLLFRRSRLDYPAYLKKQARHIWLPFALWSAVYLLYYHNFNAHTFLESLLLGNAAAHLWFVVMILQYSLLAPVLRAAWAKGQALCGDSKWKQALALLLPAVIALLFLSFSTRPYGLGILDEVFFRQRALLFLSYLLFFLAGALFGKAYTRSMTVLKQIWPLLLLLWGAGTADALWRGLCYIAETGTISFSQFSYLTPKGAFVTLCGILLLLRLAGTLERSQRVRALCSSISRYSYDAYLCHMLVMSILSRLTIHFFPALPLPFFYLWLLPAATVASLLYGAIMEKLRAKLPF